MSGSWLSQAFGIRGDQLLGTRFEGGRDDLADRSASGVVAVFGVWGRACACEVSHHSVVSHVAGGAQGGLDRVAHRQDLVPRVLGDSTGRGVVRQAEETSHNSVRAVRSPRVGFSKMPRPRSNRFSRRIGRPRNAACESIPADSSDSTRLRSPLNRATMPTLFC